MKNKSATLRENAISDACKTRARVPILHFCNTPSAKTTKIQVPEKDMSKVPYSVEEIGPDRQNMRRTLGESAFLLLENPSESPNSDFCNTPGAKTLILWSTANLDSK